jgi:predicted GNAT family acetyltransferase
MGIRAGGTLAAMAGERTRFGHCIEISAVCSDNGDRGRGCAASL